MPHEGKGGKGYGTMEPGISTMDDSAKGMSADQICTMAGEKAMKEAKERMKKRGMMKGG